MVPAVTWTMWSTAEASMAWSSSTYITGSSPTAPNRGNDWTIFGGGVEKVHRSAAARVWPPAARVPAGTSTVYSVAMGKRLSGSKMAVCAPAQRHLPGGVGVSVTGGGVRARSSCDVIATIGTENDTSSEGASATGPTGALRVTVSGAPAATAGTAFGTGGGKASVTVLPVRGGGFDLSRSANDFSSSCSAWIGGRRAMTRSASAWERGVVFGCGGGWSSRGSMSLRRKPRPLFERCHTTGSGALVWGGTSGGWVSTEGQPAARKATASARRGRIGT